MKELTEKQQEILGYIQRFIKKHKMSPSVNEIAEHLNITSATAFTHLLSLQRKGYISRTGKARSIVLLKGPQEEHLSVFNNWLRHVPILGRVSAGAPLLAEEHIEGEIQFDTSSLGHLSSNAQLFALKINGDSMQDAGIIDGDLLIAKATEKIKNGDIVIALVDDQTTVKSIYVHSDKIELRPANTAYAPQFYLPEQVCIQGVAVAIQRIF